jgi:hypothetical protein
MPEAWSGGTAQTREILAGLAKGMKGMGNKKACKAIGLNPNFEVEQSDWK